MTIINQYIKLKIMIDIKTKNTKAKTILIYFIPTSSMIDFLSELQNNNKKFIANVSTSFISMIGNVFILF
jgi:hypothetical protein